MSSFTMRKSASGVKQSLKLHVPRLSDIADGQLTVRMPCLLLDASSSQLDF